MSTFKPGKALAFVIAALTLAGSAAAQTSKITYTSPNGLYVAAYQTGKRAVTSRTPKGGNLIPSAKTSATLWKGTCTVSTSLSRGKHGSITTILDQSGSGYYDRWSKSVGYGQAGWSDTLLTIQPAKTTTGTLTLSWSVTTRDNASALVQVDLGNNSSIDWTPTSANASKVLRITIPTSGLAILAKHLGRGRPASSVRNPSFQSRFTLHWQPDVTPCRFTTYGKICGPLLIGSGTRTGILNFYLGSAAPTSPTLLIMGTQSVQFQLPGTTCYLATLPLLTMTSMANATGLSQFTFPLPEGKITGLMTQGVSLDFKTLKVLLSNGIRVDCP